jgi:type I restriction enzyme S subunit
MNIEIKLPKGWEVKKLGEVCDIKGGKNQSKVINPNGKYPIYGSSGIFGYADEYLCDEGTTIIGRKGTINNPIYISTKFWNVDTAFGLCSKNGLDSKFLFYFCKGFNFHKLDKSTTIPSLAKSDLLTIELPIPPLSEQTAIVSKIEELLSDLENGKQQLLTAQAQLKVYRKSLIMDGVTGKLTQKWRVENPDIDSSEKVFQKIQNQLDKSFAVACDEAIKNGKRKPKDQRKNKKTVNVLSDLPKLPLSWNYYRLEDITYLVTDGTHFTPKYQDNGVKFQHECHLGYN